MTRIYTAIGLMSGTSMDGIDAALIETDGADLVRPLDFLTIPYDDDLRSKIRAVFGRHDRTDPAVLEAEALSTDAHIRAITALLQKTGRKAADIDLIGYHGQTIFHAPADRITVQLGDGARMARETGIAVVYDMRANDVKLGGEGAPLAPLYHCARVKSDNLDLPCVILNIGGVSNVTYIGRDEHDVLAFDTGPGNALMDDWIQKHTGARYDKDGLLAASGTPDPDILAGWMSHSYFSRKPPKSLDRNEWDIAAMGPLAEKIDGARVQDGAATLLEFTVTAIAAARRWMPEEPRSWYVCGGGRHNLALMDQLAGRVEGTVASVDTLGWDGDATEAECFAYLAVRSKLGLPLSLPTTTNVPAPATGGVLALP